MADKNKELKNIVIFRTDRIGEVLLSTVAVDALKEKYPDTRVTFVTSEYSAPVFRGRQDVDEVMIFDTIGGGGLLRALMLSLKLRKRRFDAAIVLNPHKTLHLACFAAGIPMRIGYDRKWGFLLNRSVPDNRDKGEKHEIEYTRDLMELIGAGNATVEGPKLYPGAEDKKNVEQILEEAGLDRRKELIAVHPGSSNAAKIWPREKYAELIKLLNETYDDEYEICLIGTDKETPLAEEIIEMSGSAGKDLTGRFSLNELIAFLSMCQLFVGNDTGPMHMAAALAVPVVAIFGRNITGVGPKRWGPWGKDNIVFHEDPGCKPCYDTDCPYGYKCMRAVTVDKVLEAVLGKLQAEDRPRTIDHRQ